LSWQVVSPAAHDVMHELKETQYESPMQAEYWLAQVPDWAVTAHEEHVLAVPTHTDPEHVCPVGQAWLHAPQLALDVVVSTHAPLHIVRPPVHPVVPPKQAPALQ
jgi:hypothetical protein